MRILIFGDSITYGAWDSQGGWADRLRQKVHQQAIDDHADGAKTFQMYNLGISGDTSASLLKRMEAEIMARKSATRPFTIVISIGSNDTLGHPTIDDVNISVEDYEKNVRQLIDIAQKYTKNVLVVGLPCLGYENVEFIGMNYHRERIREYDLACAKVCAELGIAFVDIFLPTSAVADPASLYSEDLLHPNDEGHKLIAETVWPVLNKYLVR